MSAEVGARDAVPLMLERISAGFPSPADDFIEEALDPRDLLVRHPTATFFVRVDGDSMTGAGIHNGDILVVDRSLEPGKNRIVIAALNGEMTVKRLVREDGSIVLKPENPDYQPIRVADAMQLEIWGVVTYVIHPV